MPSVRPEPLRRYEVKVDPDGALSPAERARLAKIAYRAFMRGIAMRSVKARAADCKRKDAARRRRLARPPSEKEIETFRRERAVRMDFLIIWAAAQRGEQRIAGLRRHQPERRDDCVLCRRPFVDSGALGPAGERAGDSIGKA